MRDLDRFGNRWQQNGPHSMQATFTGNNPGAPANNNRLDGFSYDAAGNLLNDSVHQYAYDAENRLISVDSSVTYAYNADGQRVHRTGYTTDNCDTTGKRDYVYDLSGHWNLEVNVNGIQCKTEIYAGSRHFVTNSGATYFDHSDWLGTVRVRNSYQSPTNFETCTSLPFGDAQTCVGGDQSTIHFTGKERDAESGLDDFGARYNSSNFGRFMSPDPGNIGVDRRYPQSWNAYSYSVNNPLNLTDPTGLYVCEDSEECDSANDKAFAKSLADAQAAANKLTGDDKAAAQRAIDAYGAQGDDNGVNVRFDSKIDGAVTEVSGVANGNKSADLNPNGQNINVTFNPNDIGGDIVAHEGSHVADGSAWVASGFASNMNPTNLTTEFNAYHVQFNILNALGVIQAPPGMKSTGASIPFSNPSHGAQGTPSRRSHRT
jgi:RHS repeat-associated protein